MTFMANKKLKMIHENAFGYADPKTFVNRTLKIKDILINGSKLTTLSRNLLPWTNLNRITLFDNVELSCNPEVGFS